MSEPAQPYRVEVPLRWSDMDAYGHVNNVQFLRLLEDARVVGIREWFVGRPSMLERGPSSSPATPSSTAHPSPTGPPRSRSRCG